MGRTEKRRPTGGWVRLGRLIRDAALVAFSIASAILAALLAVARHSQLVALALAAVLVVAGAAQLLRARHRGEDERYRRMLWRIDAEKGFGRLWVTIGVVLEALGLLTPPLLVAVLGAAASGFLLLKGFGHSGRSGDVEIDLDLSGTSAADECWRVKRWAEIAARAPFVPLARCFSELATYRVAPGQIGVLQTLILMVLAASLFAYTSLGLAIGVSGIVQGHKDKIARKHRRSGPDQSSPAAPSTTSPGADEDAAFEPPPTYAESCPTIPDPLTIGHRLGRLFQRDSAPKAGCGTQPVLVRGTGAWVSAGICDGEMRSVAVSAPGRPAAILYGEPARFAWAAAQADELVAAEAAQPAGGDVDLVEVLAGTYAFTRPSPSVSGGEKSVRRCGEVSGVARPFARLAPPLALLWLELLRHRAAWSWPVADPSNEDDPIAFLSYPSSLETARGSCEDDSSCYLDVDGERWPGIGTAYVSLSEFEPYMP